MQSTVDIHAYLIEHGIKPSVQRIAVARFLAENLTHPTVDEIYNGLLPHYPTLSRTTVYNTVRLLADSGCITWLDVDSQGARFDFRTHPHAHFACNRCGRIIDIPICGAPHPPDGFEVTAMQLSYKGLCPQCRAEG